MAIYSAKYAKELIPESICIHETGEVAPAPVKIRAVLKGERKTRVFHVSSLLAEGGKKEIQEMISELMLKPKVSPAGESSSDQSKKDAAAELHP